MQPIRKFAKIGTAILAGSFLASTVVRLACRFSFRNKVVLITGGSRGLGLALARALAARGARLVLAARDEAELERAAAGLTTHHGAQVCNVVADVRQQNQAEMAVGRTVEEFGSIDVLINNAGIITVGPLQNLDRQDYDDAMATHFWAPYFTMNAALSHMRRQSSRGRIVNISSIGGMIPVPHLAPYVASKFALTGLSRSYRAELARERIYVTTVCPGLMRTGSHINAMFKGARQQEFGWFALGSATPASSISARRAAAKILHACQTAKPLLVISLQAKSVSILSGLFPGLTDRMLAVINRFLPMPAGEIGHA